MARKKKDQQQPVEWVTWSNEKYDNPFIIKQDETGPQEWVLPAPENIVPKVDSWICPEPLALFKHVDKAIIIPITRFFGIDDPNSTLNQFNISDKRCYNKIDMRNHTCHYLNYFVNFFDQEGELYSSYCKLKYMIDVEDAYQTEDEFLIDLKRYILFNPSILTKVSLMDAYNYQIELKAKKGRSIPSLQYRTKHGHRLMQMSILMLMMIPIVTHFAHVKDIEPIDDVLLKVFDDILYMSDTDMYSKFYETATSEVGRSEKLHSTLWSMQQIRGINSVTHSYDSIINIILNMMPKYVFNDNTISFNCSAIRNSNKYKILGISYEYNFNKLSSSNRDADFQSDFDKYEAYLIRQDESLYLQNKVNEEETMRTIEDLYGPFDIQEVENYIRILTDNGRVEFNKHQRTMIFQLFYKYFGDPKSIYSINIIDYVKLIMAAKRCLLNWGIVILPYAISGKVIKMPNKKAVNKYYYTMIVNDPLWDQVCEKYNNDEGIKKDILDNIGIIISSEYMTICPENPEIDRTIIDSNLAINLIKEYLQFVLLI